MTSELEPGLLQWIARVCSSPVVSAELLPGGTEARTYKIVLQEERVVVLRSTSSKRSDNTTEALQKLALRDSASTPRLLGTHCDATEGHRHALMTYLPGASSFQLNEARLAALTSFLASLRSRAGAEGSDSSSDTADLVGIYLGNHSRYGIGDSVDDRSVSALARRLWSFALDAVQSSEPGTDYVHGDLWLGNLLWEENTLAGVVDWSKSHFGCQLADVAMLRVDLAVTGANDLVRQLSVPTSGQAMWDSLASFVFLTEAEAYWHTYVSLGARCDFGTACDRVAQFVDRFVI